MSDPIGGGGCKLCCEESFDNICLGAADGNIVVTPYRAELSLGELCPAVCRCGGGEGWERLVGVLGVKIAHKVRRVFEVCCWFPRPVGGGLALPVHQVLDAVAVDT